MAWWLVVVKPSFDPYFAIGAVHEEMWKRGPEADQHRVRGFVIEGELAAVAPLQADPIPEYLAQLSPFRVERTHRQKIRNIAPGDGDATEEFDWCEMRTLDGLGYTFQWGSKTISEGSFCFSNPRTGWTVEFERALFRFARNVDSKVGNGALNYQFERWLDYREELRHSSPVASRNEGSAG